MSKTTKGSYRSKSAISLIPAFAIAVAVFGGTALAQEAEEVQRRLEMARAQIAALEADAAQLQEKLAKAEAIHLEMQDKCKALAAELAKHRAELLLSQADRDKGLKSLVETTDALQKALAENRQLKADNKKLRELAAGAGILPTESAGPAPDEQTQTPPPGAEGVVVEVREGGVLVISLGSRNGVRPGNRLHIYRSLGDHGIYVGQIEILETRGDSATCKVISLQDTVRKGDRVVSRL
jgi:hypothetical protein